MITGVNGFIGSHLARALLAEGAQVEGLSREGRPLRYLEALGLTERVVMHRADIVARDSMTDLFASHHYDYVFHLASQSDTWKSTRSPMETFCVNVDGTLNVLEALRKSPSSPRVVVGGSVRVFQYSAVGGPQNRSGTVHPYDASKLAMETMALSYFHAYGIHGAVARNTNIYGPNDLNFSRLVPRIMKGVLTDGGLRLRGDGSLSRDFLYVEDAVDGMIRLAELVDRRPVQGRAFTFATGRNHTIRRLCNVVRACSPRPFELEWDRSSPMKDRQQKPVDVSETKEALGWSSATDLAGGVRKTMSWYRGYLEAARATVEVPEAPPLDGPTGAA